MIIISFGFDITMLIKSEIICLLIPPDDCPCGTDGALRSRSVSLE
jgi:hypothetical protein